MVYVDTNVLIYAIVNQDVEKQNLAQHRLRDALTQNLLIISPLTLQELIFSLAKLKLDHPIIRDRYDFFRQFSQHSIDQMLMDDAFDLCSQMKYGRNINDCLHLKFAERYASSLITFDDDFKPFIPLTPISIEILE